MIGNLGKVVTPTLIQIVNGLNINAIFGLNIIRLTLGTIPLLLMSIKKI